MDEQNSPVVSQPKPPIEEVTLPTRFEKLKMKALNVAGIHAIAIAVGVGGGGLTGWATQKYSRDITGFNPVENARQIKDLESKKQPHQEAVNEEERKRKQGLWSKIRETLGKSAEAVINPEEFIKNTELYKTVYYEYLLGKQRLDKATFWVPGILMLLMLWKFVSSQLTKLRGDVIRKNIDKRFAGKINELVANVNDINAAIADMQTILTAVRNGTPLTVEQATQVEDIRVFLEEHLPEPEDMALLAQLGEGAEDSSEAVENEPHGATEPVSEPHSQGDYTPATESAPPSTPSPKKPPVTDLSKW